MAWGARPAHKVVNWNAGAERIRGYKEEEEIVGQRFSDFDPPEDIERGKPEWELKPKWELKEVIEKGRIEDEGWRVRKEGWFPLPGKRSAGYLRD